MPEGKPSSSPAKRPEPSHAQPEQQSPAKRRQVDASARTTRSRAMAQQCVAPAAEAHSPAASLVSDSDADSFAVYIGSDKSSESSPEPPAGAASPGQPGPSHAQRVTAGWHPHNPALQCSALFCVIPPSAQQAVSVNATMSCTVPAVS